MVPRRVLCNNPSHVTRCGRDCSWMAMWQCAVMFCTFPDMPTTANECRECQSEGSSFLGPRLQAPDSNLSSIFGVVQVVWRSCKGTDNHFCGCASECQPMKRRPRRSAKLNALTHNSCCMFFTTVVHVINSTLV